VIGSIIRRITNTEFLYRNDVGALEVRDIPYVRNRVITRQPWSFLRRVVRE
jgi:hypothetical protein